LFFIKAFTTRFYSGRQIILEFQWYRPPPYTAVAEQLASAGGILLAGEFWLLTIATRIALDGFRKNKRLKAVSLNQRYDYTNDGCGQMVTVAIEDHTHDPLDEALT